jgi:putative redox protein
VLIDGDRKAAASPVDTLVASLAACSAVDVVEILEKRRTPAITLKVLVEFSRAPTPPRRLTEALVRFQVATACDKQNVERAVSLSIEKYCSVSASLAPDTDIKWIVEMLPFEEKAAG